MSKLITITGRSGTKLIYNYAKLKEEYESIKLPNYPDFDIIAYQCSLGNFDFFGEQKQVFKVPSLIAHGFIWKETRQGYEYWASVCSQIPLPKNSIHLTLELHKALHV